MTTSRSRIKICGLTREQDVLFADSLGAWALGFIFHPESPRYIEPFAVSKLVGAVQGSPCLTVGVFVDASKDEIVETTRASHVTAIQLHGEESPEFCADLKLTLPKHKLIKAFRLQSEEELERMPAYTMCDAKLVDAYVSGQPGGTGKIARWDLATRAKASGTLILSGGLSFENVGQALGQVRPDGFDVSSGVEDSPGIKNHAKMRSFFQTVRTYEDFS